MNIFGEENGKLPGHQQSTAEIVDGGVIIGKAPQRIAQHVDRRVDLSHFDQRHRPVGVDIGAPRVEGKGFGMRRGCAASGRSAWPTTSASCTRQPPWGSSEACSDFNSPRGAASLARLSRSSCHDGSPARRETSGESRGHQSPARSRRVASDAGDSTRRLRTSPGLELAMNER